MSLLPICVVRLIIEFMDINIRIHFGVYSKIDIHKFDFLNTFMYKMYKEINFTQRPTVYCDGKIMRLIKISSYDDCLKINYGITYINDILWFMKEIIITRLKDHLNELNEEDLMIKKWKERYHSLSIDIPDNTYWNVSSSVIYSKKPFF